jgi:hypothetical protein
MDKFPLGLKKLPRWVPYKLEEKDGRVSPVPYQLNGKRASSTDPHTWTTFEKAKEALPKGYSGLQIAIEPPFDGIDLDHCRDANTGAVEDWAKAALAQLNSYTEFSPSGTGFHVFVTGTLPPTGRRCGRVEMYGTGKLFRVTGRHAPDYPLDVNPCDCVSFHASYIEKGKGKPWDTKPAVTAGGVASDSDKEWAVVCALIEKLGPNAEAVEAEFRATQPHRIKHDEMRGPVTYLRYTIDNAIKRNGGPQPVAAESAAPNRKSITYEVYPFWAWEGTPYYDFAEKCVVDNHIPRRFFVEALKTVVGAVCGHRLRLAHNSMDARFYTVILSDRGGVGKSTGLEWIIRLLFGPTPLLYRGETTLKNIGCFYGGFGSGVGMLKRFNKSPRVLQTYDEIAVMVEKLGIKGSGQGFLGLLNDLYDSNMVPSNETKETDLGTPLPAQVWNSVLGCSIKEKWDEMFAATSADNSGLFQRLNIVAAEDIKLVAVLKEPDLTEVRSALLKKIMPLEQSVVRLEMDSAAQQMLDEWFTAFNKETHDLPSDVTGRINVLVMRNAMQIAWLLDGFKLEAVAGRNELDDAYDVGAANANNGTVYITKDVMRRAIALGRYEWATRLANRPAAGRNETARLEGTVAKHLKKASPQSRAALYKAIHGERCGLGLFKMALDNMAGMGWITIVPEAAVAGNARGGRQRDMIYWTGSGVG